MDTARQKGSWSKDRSRKVGAVIVSDDEVEVSNGWNGFPRKIDDDVEARHQRPAKYLWSEHSERNALYNAARMGRATKGCRIYQTMYPCAHCARGLIQSGIREVVTFEPDWNDLTYADEFAVTKEMLAEAGVDVRFMIGQPPERAGKVIAKIRGLMSLKKKKSIIAWTRGISFVLIFGEAIGMAAGHPSGWLLMLGVGILFLSHAFDGMA